MGVIIVPVQTSQGGGIGTLVGWLLMLLIPMLLGIPKYLKARRDLKNGNLSSYEKYMVANQKRGNTPWAIMEHRLLSSYSTLNFFICMVWCKGGLILTAVLAALVLFYFTCVS